MDEHKQGLYRRMQQELRAVLGGKGVERPLIVLTEGVLKAIEYKVHNAVANGSTTDSTTMSAYHPDVDIEFVNRPEFAHLVGQITKLKGLTIPPDEIEVFIHAFREWYNFIRPSIFLSSYFLPEHI